jgi:hypothetical protein
MTSALSFPNKQFLDQVLFLKYACLWFNLTHNNVEITLMVMVMVMGIAMTIEMVILNICST